MLRSNSAKGTHDLHEHPPRRRGGPDGSYLRGEFIPWPQYAQMSDLEIEALWRYLAVAAAQAVGAL